MLLQSKKPQPLSKSSAFYTTNLIVAENSPRYYCLKGFHQLLQFRFLFIKNVNLKQKIKSKNISASDYQIDETLRAKKWGLKTYVVLAMLITSFIFAASFSQGTEVASQTLMPTPTPTPALTLNQTIEPVATPELTSSYSNFTNFAYSAIGKYSSNNPIAKTFTLCNYTTPSHSGKIMKISIFLVGVSEVSHVKAVIFANEPNVNFPQGGATIAQSFETFNVSSVSGQWYNFTMNYSASPNTVYWLGYYSDNQTCYFYDESNSSITVTSQPKDGTSTWLPVGWAYQGKTTMSLDALYAYTNPGSTIIAPQPNSAINQSTQSYWDPVFVLLIIGGETAILLPRQAKKKNNISK